MFPSQTKINCYMLLQEGPGEREEKNRKKLWHLDVQENYLTSKELR